MYCVGLAQETPEEKNANMCPRDHFCHVLAKNAVAFCPCWKNLPEAKMKGCGLIALAEEIPDSLVLAVLFGCQGPLLRRPTMKRSKLRKENYKMYGLRRKVTPGKGNRLKESLTLSRIKGVATSERDFTLLTFKLVERD